jgi:deazaflavin-dependent oxidoreductase (nitroreductase family)
LSRAPARSPLVRLVRSGAAADPDAACDRSSEHPRMASTYRLTAPRRILNAVMLALLRLGIAPRGTYLLTARGRRTGTPHSTPVTLVENEDGRWLVAPYGAVGWVRNVRAAGQVTLSRGRQTDDFQVEEVEGQEAARVLQAYLRKVRVVRPYFDAGPDSPLEAFAAEASRHPVFSLHRHPMEG